MFTQTHNVIYYSAAYHITLQSQPIGPVRSQSVLDGTSLPCPITVQYDTIVCSE